MAPAVGDQHPEKAKMMAGELYWSMGPELLAERMACRALVHQFNSALAYDDVEGRTRVMAKLLGSMDPASPPFIEPPFRCDYGFNIHIGSDVFINFNCCILDCNKVTIGSRVLFGPNVQLYAAGHPVDPSMRNGTQGPEFAFPIVIGDDCWLGGSCIVMPGVTVGSGSVVGAGAVVTKDVPPYSVVAGNPARVLRTIVPGAGDVTGSWRAQQAAAAAEAATIGAAS